MEIKALHICNIKIIFTVIIIVILNTIEYNNIESLFNSETGICLFWYIVKLVLSVTGIYLFPCTKC